MNEKPLTSMGVCPICSAHDYTRLFDKHGHAVSRCTSCGHQFTFSPSPKDHVAVVYDDSYFSGGGAGYPDYLLEREIIRSHGNAYGKVLHAYVTPRTVLDVGAAAGFFLQGLIDQGWTGMGIEPNGTMARYARDSLGLEVMTTTLEHFQSTQMFDLVSMVQVVPHFQNPRTSLAAAARITRPGGLWLIETWDRESLTARTLGRYWHEYSPPSVLHWFSRASLSELVQEFGFQPVAWGKPKKRLKGAHLKSLALHHVNRNHLPGRLMSTALRLVPDRLSLPYPAEDLFWVLFQKT